MSKNTLYNLIAFIVISTIVYFAAAIVAISLNPVDWHWVLRLIFVFAMIRNIGLFLRDL